MLEIASISKAGSCNFCYKGRMVKGRIEYPYDYVYIIRGTSIEVRACEDCMHNIFRHYKKEITCNLNNVKITAINKRTGERVKPDLISLEQKKFFLRNRENKDWDNNFSKRGEWKIILKHAL